MEEAALVTRRWKLKTFWYEEKKRQLNRFKENKKSRKLGIDVRGKNTRLCCEVEGWDLKGRHEEWEEEEEGGCLLIKVSRRREKQQACAREKQKEEDAGEDVSRVEMKMKRRDRHRGTRNISQADFNGSNWLKWTKMNTDSCPAQQWRGFYWSLINQEISWSSTTWTSNRTQIFMYSFIMSLLPPSKKSTVCL